MIESFFEFMRHKYSKKVEGGRKFKNNRFGDLTYDMTRDIRFPWCSADKDEIKRYLIWSNACPACMETFEAAWKKYKKEVLSDEKI